VYPGPSGTAHEAAQKQKTASTIANKNREYNRALTAD
jgi:hypothetical protein